MPTGRKICDILKDIRKTVSESEGIDLHQSECHHKGECSGTCPKCEAELKEINNKVNHNKLLTIGTATLAAISLSACGTDTSDDLSGDVSVSVESNYSLDNVVKSKEIERTATTESSTSEKTTESSEKESSTTETETTIEEATTEVDTDTINYYEISGDIAGTLTNSELGYSEESTTVENETSTEITTSEN
jgi:hypothetical protein